MSSDMDKVNQPSIEEHTIEKQGILEEAAHLGGRIAGAAKTTAVAAKESVINAAEFTKEKAVAAKDYLVGGPTSSEHLTNREVMGTTDTLKAEQMIGEGVKDHTTMENKHMMNQEFQQTLDKGGVGGVLGGGFSHDEKVMGRDFQRKEFLGQKEFLGGQKDKEFLGADKDKEFLGADKDKEFLGGQGDFLGRQQDKEVLGGQKDKEFLGGQRDVLGLSDEWGTKDVLGESKTEKIIGEGGLDKTTMENKQMMNQEFMDKGGVVGGGLRDDKAIGQNFERPEGFHADEGGVLGTEREVLGERREVLGERTDKSRFDNASNVGISDKAGQLKDAALEKGAQWKDAALEKGEQWKDVACDKAAQIRDDAVDRGYQLKDAAVDKGHHLKERAIDKGDQLKQKGHSMKRAHNKGFADQEARAYDKENAKI